MRYLLSLLLLMALPGLAIADPADNPIVVELFTSQGCNSCPPAEALLHDLAAEEDLIALEFHVDYWDKLGWPDPFALPQATQRQRNYGSWFSLSYIYTPQMVIDGEVETVGSRRGEVLNAIVAARELQKSVLVEIDPSGQARLSGPKLGQEAVLWFVTYDAAHETDVLRGENAGKQLVNTNVVRSIEALGGYEGGERQLSLPLDPARSDGRSHAVLLVQADGHGPILGAGRIALAPES